MKKTFTKLSIALVAMAFIVINNLNAQTYNITTIAGNGTGAYSGDGGAATAAEVYYPFGVAIDASGNLYIADYANSAIRKVSNLGIITTIAGNNTAGYSGDGGAATAAELNAPHGVAVDASGNVYIADESNQRIRKVNTSGIISTIAGNGTGAYSGDGGAATAAQIYNPYGVAVDASGNVYIADESNHRIRKVNTSGIISTIAGNGTGAYSGDGGAATAAELHFPNGVVVDASGNLYIADTYNYRIRKVNTAGIITTIAGNGIGAYSGDGGAATAAELHYPTNLTIDASGNMYIADFNNYRIRKVSTSGFISTIAGNGNLGYSGDGGAATAAELGVTEGVTVDAAGNVYFADSKNNCIRKISTSGIISTIAGNGAPGYSGDGGSATAAELYYPYGVVIDASGNVYFADTFNNRIRKLTPITTGIATLSESNSTGLYPNPATTNLSLSFTMQGKATKATINIFDVTGKSMLETNTEISNGKTIPIDISQLSTGVYFVKITTAKTYQTIKFVKTDR